MFDIHSSSSGVKPFATLRLGLSHNHDYQGTLNIICHCEEDIVLIGHILSIAHVLTILLNLSDIIRYINKLILDSDES